MNPGHLLFYLAAFALALGVLIVVHEFGHYAVARWCGVKVLRFSIGFGQPLLMRRFGKDGTEWALATFPLGGYVKMLDEGEAPVPADELHRAFNRLSVSRRMLIVIAGPLANLLLAVVLYWVLLVNGVAEVRPVLGAPPAGSVAASAGVESGDTVRRINGNAIETWQQLKVGILNLALQRQPLDLETVNARGEIANHHVDTRVANLSDLEGELMQQLGLLLYRPVLKPVVGSVSPDQAAALAGIRPGDEFIAIDGKPVGSSLEVVAAIAPAAGKTVNVELRRATEMLSLNVMPREFKDGGKRTGRIGITFKDDPKEHLDMVTVIRYSPLTAIGKAAEQTWDTSVLYLKLVGRMIAGQISWKNLSGPVTIADYAGQSASAGVGPYLTFLALISISLGVLNLLPIPILDGGHLLYYLAEIVKGGPLPERIAELGRQIGFALLVLLMIFAFYNDINRLISG